VVKQILSFLSQGLVRGGLRVMVVSATGIGLAYVIHVFLARWLGVEAYGHYVYALAWLNVLVTFVQMGMNTSTLRLTAELRAKANHGAILGLSRFSTVLVLAAGGVVFLVGGLVLIAVDAWGVGSFAQTQTLAIMLPLVVVLGLLNQRMAILQGFERVAQAQSFLNIVRPLLFLGILLAVLPLVNSDSRLTMGANLAATVLALAVVTVVVRRLLVRETSTVGCVREYHSRAWLAVSLPYLAIGGLTVLMDQSDVLILGTLMGGTVAGFYLSAVKLSQLILFPMLAIRAQVAPVLSKMHAEKNIAEVQRHMNTTTVSSVLTGIVLMSGIIWFRVFLLSLFGPEFVEAAPAIVVLSVAMVVFAMTGGVEVFLIIGPFESLILKIYGLVVVANLLLNLSLVPLFGFMGAAYATAATIVLRGGLSVYVVWRKTGVLPWAPLPVETNLTEER